MTKDEMSTAHADFSSLQIVHLRVERTHVMWIDAASSAWGITVGAKRCGSATPSGDLLECAHN
jgi:hypothetical protein